MTLLTPGPTTFPHPDIRRVGRIRFSVGICAVDSGACSLDGTQDVGHSRWIVTLHSSDEEEGLVWCLVWLMFPELGIGPFLAARRVHREARLRSIANSSFAGRHEDRCSVGFRSPDKSLSTRRGASLCSANVASLPC